MNVLIAIEIFAIGYLLGLVIGFLLQRTQYTSLPIAPTRTDPNNFGSTD